MNWPTSAQIYTALRYIGTASATFGSVMTLLGIMPDNKAHAIVEAFQKLMTDLQPVVGDLYVLIGLIGPLVVFALGKIGWNSARPANQVAAVQARADTQVLTSNPSLAEIPGVKLVPPEMIPPNSKTHGV